MLQIRSVKPGSLFVSHLHISLAVVTDLGKEDAIIMTGLHWPLHTVSHWYWKQGHWTEANCR